MSSYDNNKLFSTIATRYDFLNHLLSLNIDKSWRRRLVRYAGVIPDEKILDVCCGTGDLAILFAQEDGAGEIVGVDLSEEMLHVAKRKISGNGFAKRIKLVEGDALHLPFEDDYFDIVSIGFGLRNIGQHKKGISEMVRVLKDGGRLLILEFSPPSHGFFGACYRLYLNTAIRTVGGIISGSANAYRYLSSSIANFPKPQEIVKLMEATKLKNIYWKTLTGGIAYIYQGQK